MNEDKTRSVCDTQLDLSSDSDGSLSADSWTSPQLENEVDYKITFHYYNISTILTGDDRPQLSYV